MPDTTLAAVPWKTACSLGPSRSRGGWLGYTGGHHGLRAAGWGVFKDKVGVVGRFGRQARV